MSENDHFEGLRRALEHGCFFQAVDMTGCLFDGLYTNTIRELLKERDSLATKVRDMALDHLTSEGQWIERCDELRVERDAAVKRAEAFEADAERLRVLFGAAENDGYCWWLPELAISESGDTVPTMEGLRAAIDELNAARSAEGN